MVGRRLPPGYRCRQVGRTIRARSDAEGMGGVAVLRSGSAPAAEDVVVTTIRRMSAIFDWARPDNVQPEPITVDIWRELPDEFCRLVEVVNGDAVRCES